MLIIIDAELSAPPSEVCLFRDITLFSSCFLKKNVILECKKEERDYYYKWLKNRGSWDFIEDMVKPNTEYGFSIRPQKANIVVPRITYYNFQKIISGLSFNKI